MALVKPCRVCGRRNPPSQLVCEECTANIATIPPVDEETLSTWRGEPLRIEFPFGTVPIRGDEVIGRDNPDFGERIANSPNGGYVSGEHAVVTCEGDKFFIHHVGREDSNFTYIDDERVTEPRELRDGQKLSLSRHFHAYVRIG